MAYSNNPHLPRVRMEAVKLVRSGWGIRKTARYLGFSHAAVVKWMKIAPDDGRLVIETRSSRPKHHPKALSEEVISAIIAERKKRNRCGVIIHEHLKQQGVVVSLSSVNRTLKRCRLLKERSPWKRWHQNIERPFVAQPGDLIEVDTVHFMPKDTKRFFVYTLVDVHSRWAYAKVVSAINGPASVRFVLEAKEHAPFLFRMIQTDNGPEFKTHFTERMRVIGIPHRHSRVRKSNDNAHVERFNRTLQDECLTLQLQTITSFRKALKKYIPYYNQERLHLGIEMKTPLQVVTRY